MSEVDTILVRVPEHLKKKLKIIAVEQDSNMTEIVLKLIENFVNAHEESKKY